jgi:hypothetical protein
VTLDYGFMGWALDYFEAKTLARGTDGGTPAERDMTT